jgi:hypothetical protein
LEAFLPGLCGDPLARCPPAELQNVADSVAPSDSDDQRPQWYLIAQNNHQIRRNCYSVDRSEQAHNASAKTPATYRKVYHKQCLMALLLLVQALRQKCADHVLNVGIFHAHRNLGHTVARFHRMFPARLQIFAHLLMAQQRKDAFYQF